MALRKRNVNIKLPTAIAGQIIKITLVNWSAYQEFVLPPSSENFETDEQGEATAELWASADGLSATYYRVELPTNLENHSNPPLFFELQYGTGSDVDLSNLLIADVPAPEVGDVLYDFVIQKVETEVAEEVAEKIAEHEAESNPHPVYATDTDLAELEAGLILPSSPNTGEFIWSLRTHGEPHNDNIKCGMMWDSHADLPENQLIEIFARFNSAGQYAISDSPGGRHAGCLLGVGSDGLVTGNTYVKIGGVYSSVSYGSGIPITIGDLGMLTRVQTKTGITVYWKGIPIGHKLFSGDATRNYDDVTAQGHLYFGAVNHQGKDCNFVFARIYEGSKIIPFTDRSAFAPARSVAHNSQNRITDVNFAFNGIWSFSNPFNGDFIPDLSAGMEVIEGEGVVPHHGYLSDSLGNTEFYSPDAETTEVKPVYERILFGQSPFIESIPTPPSGALVYDSHTRADSTKQWSQTSSPGTGETGGDWSGATQYAAIISKYLSLTELWQPIWKLSPVADYQVTYTRASSPLLYYPGHYETYLPKQIDADNAVTITFDGYGNAYFYDNSSRYGGGDTLNDPVDVGLTWTRLRCRFVARTMQVYVDEVLKATVAIPARYDGMLKAGIMDSSDNLRKLKSILIKAS